MTKSIYLAWQDQNLRRWHVIGQLLRTDEGYEFRYTHGVKNIQSFAALPNMPEHDKVYRSPELFSLFKNRVMPKSRPEYSDYISWMGIETKGLVNDLDTLAISGGERETDFFRIIPIPEKDMNGNYSFKFFVNGINHMPDNSKKIVNELQGGDSLYLAHDFQNHEDPLALFLRTGAPPCLIGYIPAYFAKVIHKVREERANDPKVVIVNVVKVNKDAPIQMRLLCELSSSTLNKPWDEYEPEFKLICP